MLPSVMGSIGWSKRGHARALPRSMNLRYNPVAAQPCVALCAKRRQVCCPDEAAGFVVRSFAGAQADHIRSAGRGDRQHNSERKQGRQNAASSPSHVNPLDLKRISAGIVENAAFYQGRRAPARTDAGTTLFHAGQPAASPSLLEPRQRGGESLARLVRAVLRPTPSQQERRPAASRGHTCHAPVAGA
jgi:hypothetical protein